MLSFCHSFSYILICNQQTMSVYATNWHFIFADSEALSYQVTTTFDTSCAARLPTALAIKYTVCWQLVFIHIRLFIIYLAFFLSLLNCTGKIGAYPPTRISFNRSFLWLKQA